MYLPLSIPKEEKSKEDAFTFILLRIKAAIRCYEMQWKDEYFKEIEEDDWWTWCYDDGMEWQAEHNQGVFNKLAREKKYAEAADYRRKYNTVKITSKESVIPSKQEVKEIL